MTVIVLKEEIEFSILLKLIPIFLTIFFLFLKNPIFNLLGSSFLILILPYIPITFYFHKKLKLSFIEFFLLPSFLAFIINPFILIGLTMLTFNKFSIILIFFLIYLFQLILFRKFDTGIFLTLFSKKHFNKKNLVLWLIIFLYILFLSIPILNVGIENPTGSFLKPFIYITQNKYEVFPKIFSMDFLKHIGFVNELSKGEMLPKNPFFSTENLHYYWFYHIIAASIQIVSGVSTFAVFKFLSIFLSIIFFFLIYSILTKYVKNYNVILISLLLLTFFNSYEYVNAFLIEKNISLSPLAMYDFFIKKLTLNGGEFGNIEYYISFYQNGLQKFFWYLPHVITSIYIFLWWLNLYLNKNVNKKYFQLFSGVSLATLMMYNSFIFGISLILYFFISFLEFREKTFPLFLYLLPLFFILSIINYINILIFAILSLFLLFRINLNKFISEIFGVIFALLLGIIFYQNLIGGYTSTFFNYNWGMMLNGYFIDNYALKAFRESSHNFLILNLFFTLFSLPILFFISSRKLKKIYKFSAFIIFISLILLLNIREIGLFPENSPLFNLYFLKEYTKNLFGLNLFILEAGPAILFFPFLFFSWKNFKEEFFRIMIIFFLVSFIVLNTFYVGYSLFDFLGKISTINRVFLSILGGYAISAFLDLTKKHIFSIFLVGLILFLTLPNFIGDVYWHTNTKGSWTYGHIKNITNWIKENTEKNEIIQKYPYQSSYDIATFSDRRTIIGDIMSASFAINSEKIKKISSNIDLAFTTNNTWLSYDILKNYGVSYVWTDDYNVINKFNNSNLFLPEYNFNNNYIFKLKIT